MTWAEVLAIINVVMLIGMPVGVFIAVKGSKATTEQAIQERTLNALDMENKLLQSQIKRLEEEVKKKDRTLETIKALTPLKRRGLHIEINGDTVILVDERTGNSFEVQVMQEDTPAEKKGENQHE